jgi:lipid-A-disaccharide synthase
MVRLFISTGEVSGDLQGALLIEALRQQAEVLGLELEIVALGGDRMARAGATLLSNTSAIGSVGLTESLRYILPTLNIQRRAKHYLQQSPPDLVVLIDYIAANASMGTYVRRHFQVPIVYYIAPQDWVWSFSPRTTQQIIKLCDRLLAIFPEEARYYAAKGAQVTWVGHPLVDYLAAAPDRETARHRLGIPANQLAIALVPASRQQEIKYLLPVIFEAAQQIQTQLPQVQFLIPLSLEKYRQPIAQAIQDYGLQATLVSGSHTVLAAADLVIAKSGTVNLEAALLNIPQVVVYRLSPLSAWIGRNLLNFSIPFAAPPNLVEMQPIVPELLQEAATPDRIAQTALELLLNPDRRQQMLEGYQKMRQALGEIGAVDRAAQEILQLLVPASRERVIDAETALDRPFGPEPG